VALKGISEERFKLLAWHLIDTSRELGFTLEEFQRAVAFLYGWACYDASENIKKSMLTLVEHGMSKFFRNYK